jgi:spore coat polysaccharide biosynthesis protein SpsF
MDKRVNPGRIVAIIQARMGASRLPGKVLLDIGGEPMLVRVVERTRRSRLVDNVVVATTSEVQDDPLADLCAARRYPFYRGSLHDVLDRFYQAARTFGAEVIVRITADCPVIDPALVNETVQMLTTSDCDYVANRLPPPWGRTYPIGLDVEVCTFAALERAWKEADQPFQREHVMPYLYEGIPPESLAHGKSHIAQAVSPRGFHVALLHHHLDYGSLRWTVDTPEDLELLRRIYSRFGGRDDFSWHDVVALWQREPDLFKVNVSVKHKTAFDVDERRKKE